MEYLGDKLSVAHSQVSGWMGNVRRSLQGALNLVSSGVERRSAGGRGDDGGGFKRAASLRSLASRSQESFRRFSLRSQQRLSLRRRTTSLASPSTPSSELVKQCVSGQQENKDTDNLVQETDSQYSTWETGLRTDDSLTPATTSSDDNLSPSPRKPTPPHTAEQPLLIDTPDGLTTSPQKQTELPFPETPTTLLDSSALRARVSLNKKSTRRAPPSRVARHSALLSQVPEGIGADDEWRYKDSTEEKTDSPKQGEDSDSEEQAKGIESRTSSVSQPQRVALFPGMDPSALKAQLKKRGESDNQTDGPTPPQLSRAPKSPFLPRASRVLPPAGGKENVEEASPQWLKELKTKKRLSQYENDGTA
uniref:Si:ch73-138n13.1 n=1 Tax=Cyprinus carpio TaxID=7962 RepID=A0A8C1NT70_CYPCA